MKSIFLTVVVICALAIGGVGGTLATWSDSETSHGNTITTGSVDLKVNGADDLPWGTGVPTKVDIDCMIPCKMYGPFEVELWNAGICEWDSRAYIHLGNACCFNAPPKEGSGYACPETGDMKPEPELVAEFGGMVSQYEVPGVGIQGDNCTMASHVRMWVVADDPTYIPVDNDTNPLVVVEGKLGELECEELYLFDLTPCNARTIYLWFHLQQESEEDFGLDFIADPGDAGYDELFWKKFNDWPSWAMMRDKVQFSLEFDLYLEEPLE